MKKTINQQKPPSAKYITFRMDDPDFSAKYLKMHLKRPELIEFLRELFGGGGILHTTPFTRRNRLIRS